MYFGRSEHNIDAKGRLNLPSRLGFSAKDELRLLEIGNGCLWLMTVPEYETLFAAVWAADAFDEDALEMQEELFGTTSGPVVDDDGRIQIPIEFRRNDEFEKEVVIVGAGNRVTIWPASKAPERKKGSVMSNYREFAKKTGIKASSKPSPEPTEGD